MSNLTPLDKFDAWKKEILNTADEHFPQILGREARLEDFSWEIFKGYFEEGLTPLEALFKDFKTNVENIPGMNPLPLYEYAGLVKEGMYQVKLNKEQASVILKAHDYGISALIDEEAALLDQVVSLLKGQIWA